VTAPHGTFEWLVVAVATLFGLLVGSFLNVVVYRAPLGLSVSKPRSFCPTCDRQLSWWENVPVVSWLALRGRCHTCHQAISVRYPLVEVATAVSFGLVAWAWHGNALTAGYCALAAATIAGALIEFGGSRTPLSVGAVGTGVGLVFVVVAALWLDRWPVAVWSLVGVAAGAVVFGVLRANDPGCRDPLWHGRALLPGAGCWLGGIGGVSGTAVVAGAAAWILAEAACLVVLWATLRAPSVSRTDDGGGGGAPGQPPVASVPLVTGIVVALVVSLIVAT
jgi:leader peptidase (prepilin peptidase)/N-methyltransferase